VSSLALDFDQLPIPSGACDLDGTIFTINQAGATLLGRPVADIVGKKTWELAPGAEHIWEEVLRLANEHGQYQGEITIATPVGPRRIHYLAALRAQGERPALVLFAIQSDLSAAQTRETDLNAEQRLEALGLVAGGIAHDFNNQLTSVLAEASAAREDKTLQVAVKESMRRIEAAATRMAQLTRQLLAYAGRGRIVTEVFDADQLVRDARDELKRIARPHVVLELEPGAGAAAIEADRSLLLQVLANLVANASESQSRDGSITITTSTQQRSDGTAWWQLQARDHGTGMDPETVARIWDPFFTTKPGHHGLGLSAVVGIVRRHGGEVHVESKPGDGSTFTVRLPLVTGKGLSRPTRDTATHVQMRADLEGKRALIADDEPSVRTTIRRLLERRKATVVTAADGAEAEASLHEGGFDLIVLDVMMPELTGYQLLPIARATNPNARVMLMSGYTDVARGAGGEAEPDAFLEKPFTSKGFDEAIDHLLRSPILPHGS
jgi:signal transduction histidine kinase/CheY-like chemotaxis protein